MALPLQYDATYAEGYVYTFRRIVTRAPASPLNRAGYGIGGGIGVDVPRGTFIEVARDSLSTPPIDRNSTRARIGTQHVDQWGLTPETVQFVTDSEPPTFRPTTRYSYIAASADGETNYYMDNRDLGWVSTPNLTPRPTTVEVAPSVTTVEVTPAPPPPPEPVRIEETLVNAAIGLCAVPLGGTVRVESVRIAGMELPESQWTFYPGSEDQEASPLMVADTGDLTPAHRGLAYIVVQDVRIQDLASFGPPEIGITTTVPVTGIGPAITYCRSTETGQLVSNYGPGYGGTGRAIDAGQHNGDPPAGLQRCAPGDYGFGIIVTEGGAFTAIYAASSVDTARIIEDGESLFALAMEWLEYRLAQVASSTPVEAALVTSADATSQTRMVLRGWLYCDAASDVELVPWARAYLSEGDDGEPTIRNQWEAWFIVISTSQAILATADVPVSQGITLNAEEAASGGNRYWTEDRTTVLPDGTISGTLTIYQTIDGASLYPQSYSPCLPGSVPRGF